MLFRIFIIFSLILISGCAIQPMPADYRTKRSAIMESMDDDLLCLEYRAIRGAMQNMNSATEKAIVDRIMVMKQVALNELTKRKLILDEQIQDLDKGLMSTGYTRCAVLISMGSPTDINTTVGKFGKHEQWVYKGNSFYGRIIQYSEKTRYIYLENGIVTSWQF